MVDLKAYEARLLTEKKEVMRAIEDGEESRQTVELDQTAVGRLSRMDAMQAQEMAKAAQRGHSVRLVKINNALIRMEEGDYGYCTTCDEPIGQGRLDVDPATPLCVSCADKK